MSAAAAATTPVVAARSASRSRVPRGAAGFGASSFSPSRSTSRSRAPTNNVFASITRSISRSLSRSRSRAPVTRQDSAGHQKTAIAAVSRSSSREPRGAAGFGASSSSLGASAGSASREPSRGRAAALSVEESSARTASGSRSRTRFAPLERVAELVSPSKEPVKYEQTWGMAGLGLNEREVSAAQERAGERERSESRGRTVEGRAGKGREESRARSLGRSLLAGTGMERTA
ncbi:hypothetical protein JCM11641_006104 [Rhodosporidiobolus odoratus]